MGRSHAWRAIAGLAAVLAVVTAAAPLSGSAEESVARHVQPFLEYGASHPYEFPPAAYVLARSPSQNPSNTYAGCPDFPGTAGGSSGGWFDTDIYNAPVASSITFRGDNTTASSAQLISDAASANVVGFNVWPAYEVVNTPSSVSLDPVTSCTSGQEAPVTCSLPGPAKQYSGSGAPALPTLYWGASGGDPQYIVIATASCRLWAGYIQGSGFKQGQFSTFDNIGGLFDLTKPLPQKGSGWGEHLGSVPGGTSAGIPVAAFGIKPGELQAAENAGGYLHHALGWEAPGNEPPIPTVVDPHGWVAPAIYENTPTACSTASPCMPKGAHIRLKTNFDDSGWSRGAKVVAETLKHYGAYLIDTGCCYEIARLLQDDSGIDIGTLWSFRDTNYIKTLKITNFDVVSPSDSNAPN